MDDSTEKRILDFLERGAEGRSYVTEQVRKLIGHVCEDSNGKKSLLTRMDLAEEWRRKRDEEREEAANTARDIAADFRKKINAGIVTVAVSVVLGLGGIVWGIVKPGIALQAVAEPKQVEAKKDDPLEEQKKKFDKYVEDQMKRLDDERRRTDRRGDRRDRDDRPPLPVSPMGKSIHADGQTPKLRQEKN